MNTTKKFGLSQFALQNVKAQTGFGQLSSLYKYHGAPVVSMAVAEANVARNNQSHNHNHGGRVSKLIGVKKTLVNQMQGMVQSSRPKMKSRALSQAVSSKYSIYGQTKLFSSMSSLQGRSSNSSRITPALTHRRCLSTVSPRENPAHYIVHQRYHQSTKWQEKRNEDIARDISLSIKAELMDVDSDTKRLISCTRSRYANLQANSQANSNAIDQQKDDDGEQALHQRQKLQKTYPYDSLDSLKGSYDCNRHIDHDWDLGKERKPLRRKLRNLRLKDESKASVNNQQFVQPSLQSRKLQSQLGELYVRTAMERTNKQRLPHLDHIELMPAPSANSQKNSGNDRFKQSSSERDLIDRNLFGSASAAGSVSKHDDGEIGRMDDHRYQSKMAGSLMSASQRVINRQFEGYRKEMNDSHNKSKQIKLVKHLVKTVNPSPPSKVPSRPPAAPKTRTKTLRAKESSVKDATQLWKRQKPQPVRLLDRYSEHFMEKLAEKPQRSLSSLPLWKSKGSFEKKTLPTVNQLAQMQMGEKRLNQKEDGNPNEILQNNMLMPPVYTKESAVQRLGTLVEKPATSFHQRSLRARN